MGKSGAGPSVVDLYDDAALLSSTPRPFGGIRLPDGRALAWAEYGSSCGVPCVLLPETGSSRMAPRWLMHDTVVPVGVRLLALDRPGIGVSDPVGLGGREDLVEDLRQLVEILAVGRVAVIGVGQGAADALAFAVGYPAMVTSVLAVSPRMFPERAARRYVLRPSSWSTRTTLAGPVAAWLRAAGHSADLTTERTWERATHRMDPVAARVLGDRWHDSDFRQWLADDLVQAAGSWTLPSVALPQPAWEDTVCPVQVRIWHGRDETGTTLGHVRTVAERRLRWQLSVVDGCSALFGSWTQILRAAADSFGPAAA